MKTRKAAASFLEAKHDLSPRTLEQYSQALEYLASEYPRMVRKPGPVRKALNQVSSIWVRDAFWRTWSVFFRWCSEEYGTVNPMVRVERPRRPETEMRALEPEELAGVLAAAHSDRDKALVALALDCGLRASEFGRLRRLDIGTNAVRVFGKGRREAWVPITPETRHLLTVLIEKSNGAGLASPLFVHDDGHPMSRFTVYRIVRRCMDRANIPGPKRGPHCLRHSLGRHFIASGGDAFTLKQILRHRNITTTQKYVHLAMRDVLSQHIKHSPLRAALRGSQGVLLDREVEDILHGASDTVPTPT